MKKIIKLGLLAIVCANIVGILFAFPRNGKKTILQSLAWDIYYQNKKITEKEIDNLKDCSEEDKDTLRSFIDNVKEVKIKSEKMRDGWLKILVHIDRTFIELLSRNRTLLLEILIVEQFYRTSSRNKALALRIDQEVSAACNKIKERGENEDLLEIEKFKRELDLIAQQTIGVSYSQYESAFNKRANSAKEHSLNIINQTRRRREVIAQENAKFNEILLLFITEMAGEEAALNFARLSIK